MKSRYKLTLIVFAVGGLIVVAWSSKLPTLLTNAKAFDVPAATPTPNPRSVRELVFIDGTFDGQPLLRSDEEWKKLLTDEEFYILRQEGTERAYTGSLLNNKKAGTYHCAACGLAVFSSKHKYDSETGWPSFYQPIAKQNVTERPDRTLSEERVEIECSRCGSHLGHVFDDGPRPTGLRYCMNSVSLRFKPAK